VIRTRSICWSRSLSASSSAPPTDIRRADSRWRSGCCIALPRTSWTEVCHHVVVAAQMRDEVVEVASIGGIADFPGFQPGRPVSFTRRGAHDHVRGPFSWLRWWCRAPCPLWRIVPRCRSVGLRHHAGLKIRKKKKKLSVAVTRRWLEFSYQHLAGPVHDRLRRAAGR